MLWIWFYGNRGGGGLSQGDGAPVLKVLVRVGVPVWDHRGTQELVVSVRGSPPSPADGSPGWLHNVTPSLCRVRRRGESLPRPAYCEILAPLEKLSRVSMDNKERRPQGVRAGEAAWLFPCSL